MNENIVDARSLRCPQPLMLAKKALEGLAVGERLRILIDNDTSRDNLVRYLRDHGMTPVLDSDGSTYRIDVEKGEAQQLGEAALYCTPGQPATAPVFVISRGSMGSGSEELGRILLQACLNTLKELAPLPSAILCYNAGVHAAAEGSPTASALAELEKRGVTVLVCGTCVDYFDLKGKIAAGTISNMYDILQRMTGGAQVITL